MELNDYAKHALSTAFFPGRGTERGLFYPALKLSGESGEVAEKVGKLIRDKDFPNTPLSPEAKNALLLELGDVLWYIAALAECLGFTLQDVAEENLVKLTSRSARGVLGGSGDNR